MGGIKGCEEEKKGKNEIKIDSVGTRWEEDTSRGISTIPREENKIEEKSEKPFFLIFTQTVDGPILRSNFPIRLPDTFADPSLISKASEQTNHHTVSFLS